MESAVITAPPHTALTRADIERIIREQGLTPSLFDRRHYSSIAKMRISTVIRAYQGRTLHHFGMLHDIAKLDEEQLVALIAAKIAPKAGQP